MSSTRAIHAQRPDGRESWGAARSPRASRVVAAAVLGLVVGAAVGGVAGALHHQTRSASALLSIQPDPPIASDLGATSSSPSDSAVSSFMATELVYLQSDAFAARVRSASGGAPVSLQATQVQSSSVVEITALDTSPQRALAVDRAAAKVYTSARRAQVTELLTTQAASVQTQLAKVQDQLNALPATPTTQTNAAAAQRTALQSNYLDLLTASGQVSSAQARSASVVTQIQSATLTAAAGVHPLVLGIVAGAALGALLAAIGVVLLRRASSTIDGAEDLSPYGVAVLEPHVPFRRLRAGRVDDAVAQHAVAAQEPQLTGDAEGAPGLVVMGPHAGAGASYLALQHALYSARRRPTLLVRTSGGDDDLLEADLGVDCGSVAFRRLLDGPIRPADLEVAVQETSYPGLLVLPVGPDAEVGIAHLEALVDNGLLAAAADAGWRAVLDAPPLDSSTAGLAAARQCGSSVLVVAPDRTARGDVERALESAAAWRVRLTGVVLNHGGERRRGAAPLVPFAGPGRRLLGRTPTASGVS